MIERWLVAVRDHPNRPPPLQCHVLTCLALRLDWATGRGFASTLTLIKDASAEERTVRRATRWGRDTGFVVRIRRGHRIDAERTAASIWQLTMPGYPQAESQPATGGLLGTQPANGADPTGQSAQPNRPAAQHYQESSKSQPSSSSPAGHRDLLALDPTVTERETNEVIRILALRGARSPIAVLHKEIAHGNGYVLITEARHWLDRASWQQEETHVRPPRLTCPTCGRVPATGHAPSCSAGDPL